MKYLGIDYGKKKVGLAISEGISVSSLKVIDITSLVDAVNKIEKVIFDESIDTVVIGISESGESRKITQKFIQELKQKLPNIIFHEISETLTTKRAQDKMIQIGTSKKSRKKDDAISAVIILEDYLESKRDR